MKITSRLELLNRIIQTIEDDIYPLTDKAVACGCKVFGAAILRKSDLSLVLAGTNNEVANPLWHGEVHTLKLFYEIPNTLRPDTSECIFVSTHEPCSMCLSAITWVGFDNFYYLFAYTDTAEKFNIPHDLKILHEVFGVEKGNYRRSNSFWSSHSIVDLMSELADPDKAGLENRVRVIATLYDGLSERYQESKHNSAIPLS